MADPHSVPLPQSRGSLDAPRPAPSPSIDPLPALHEHSASVDNTPQDDEDEDDGAAEWDISVPPVEADEEPVTIEDQVGEAPAGEEEGLVEQVQEELAPEPEAPVEYAQADDERVRLLEDELERARADRDAFESQYQGLLGKLTTMRNTLGEKLKQDAVSFPLYPSHDLPLIQKTKTGRTRPARSRNRRLARRQRRPLGRPRDAQIRVDPVALGLGRPANRSGAAAPSSVR